MNRAEIKEINSFLFFFSLYFSCQAHIWFAFSGVCDLVKMSKDIDYAPKVLLYIYLSYIYFGP